MKVSRAHRHLGHCTMTMMQIDLAFGKTGITVDLPEGFQYRVLEARTATATAGLAGCFGIGVGPADRRAAA